MEAWLTDAVRVGQARGDIRADAPGLVLAHRTIALVDGLQQQWLLHPGRVSMAEEFGAYMAELHARWGTAPEREG